MKTFRSFTQDRKELTEWAAGEAQHDAAQSLDEISESHKDTLADKTASNSEKRISRQVLLAASISCIQISLITESPGYVDQLLSSRAKNSRNNP